MGVELRTFILLATVLAGLSAGADMRLRAFSFNGVSNRFLTPNGDARNDNIAFKFSNPHDAAGSVKIYDLRGHLVTTIPVDAGTGASQVVWDGRAGGQMVGTGIYVYVIHVEDVVYSGSVVVVR